jgi:hypothetical protein
MKSTGTITDKGGNGMNIETLKACVSALAVMLVALLGAAGIDVDATALSNVLHALAFLVAIGWGIWKNHNFTEAAQDAQAFLDCIKAAPPENADTNE